MLYKYPVYETVNGITLVFRGPTLDPVADKADRHPKDKEGYTYEYFLWKHGDQPVATYRVGPFQPTGNRVKLDAEQTKQDWWRYEINIEDQTFKRKHKNGPWELPWESVTSLRIQLDSEPNEPAAIVEMRLTDGGETIRIEHQGSDCSLTWNPATRRYTRTCRN